MHDGLGPAGFQSTDALIQYFLWEGTAHVGVQRNFWDDAEARVSQDAGRKPSGWCHPSSSPGTQVALVPLLALPTRGPSSWHSRNVAAASGAMSELRDGKVGLEWKGNSAVAGTGSRHSSPLCHSHGTARCPFVIHTGPPLITPLSFTQDPRHSLPLIHFFQLLES